MEKENKPNELAAVFKGSDSEKIAIIKQGKYFKTLSSLLYRVQGYKIREF